MGRKGNRSETPHVSYAQIKSYVYNSITYSFMDKKDKDLTKKLVAKKFLEFERKIAKLSDSFTH